MEVILEYREVQQIAKDTIAYAKRVINPGMNLLQVRKLCEQKMLELGADSFWYWDIGAFVFAGDETTISVSGKQYITSNRAIAENDIITIDLSPQNGNIWGDYARTIIIENGVVVDKADVCNEEWKNGLLMEDMLHSELLKFVNFNTTFEELYFHINELITKSGYVNLDFIVFNFDFFLTLNPKTFPDFSKIHRTGKQCPRIFLKIFMIKPCGVQDVDSHFLNQYHVLSFTFQIKKQLIIKNVVSCLIFI